MIHSRESKFRNELWLLLSAVHGLSNSGAKRNVKSDNLMLKLGFTQVKLIPQLFILMKNGKMKMTAANVVYDLRIAGPKPIVLEFI